MTDSNAPPMYGAVPTATQPNTTAPYPPADPNAPAPPFNPAAPPAQPYNYPQPGQGTGVNPQEPPPMYEPPKDGPYAAQPTPGLQTPYQAMAGQPVAVAHQTIVVNDQTYGPLPKVMMCPYCQAQITTKVEYVSGGLTWLAAGLLCLFGCWLGCCLIPFCMPDMQDVRHSCPNCHGHIASFSRL